MNNFNKKILIINIIIPLLVGFLAFLLTREGINNYSNILKPNFAPPKFLFPIVWTILYILMGISSYRIYNSMACYKNTCLIIYGLSLILNFLWPIIFFMFNSFLFAFVFIIFLTIVVLYIIICYYGIDKIAARLQIPYLVWLIFASILNFSIYFLNR